MDVLDFVRGDLKTSAKYVGVESLENIAREVGLPVEKLVKLNANENVYGAPRVVLDAIQTAEHHIYPDPAQTKLRAALAEFHGVTPEHVVAGSGSDDLLDVLIRVVGPKKIVISTPTFGMYSFLGKLFGAEVIDVPRKANFEVDVAAVKEAVRKHEATIVFLPSPNNPTGTLLSNSDVESILQERCILAVDEAYADFCDTTSLPLLAAHSNLVVMRTFSKWAGLAGLRLGYAVAHPSLVNFLLSAKQPYNVNSAAEIAGLAALTHRKDIEPTIQALRQEKDRLYEELKQFSWLRPVPSEANFVLVEVKGPSASDVYQALRKQGIIVRFFGSQGGQLHSYIRISSGKPADIDAVLQALRDIGAGLKL